MTNSVKMHNNLEKKKAIKNKDEGKIKNKI